MSAPTSMTLLGVLPQCKAAKENWLIAGTVGVVCTTTSLNQPLGCNLSKQLSLCQMLLMLPGLHLQVAFAFLFDIYQCTAGHPGSNFEDGSAGGSRLLDSAMSHLVQCRAGYEGCAAAQWMRVPQWALIRHSPFTLYSRTCSKKMMGLSLRMALLRRAFELATVEQATSCTPGIDWK